MYYILSTTYKLYFEVYYLPVLLRSTYYIPGTAYYILSTTYYNLLLINYIYLVPGTGNIYAGRNAQPKSDDYTAVISYNVLHATCVG